jgi:hypothetical protein
MVVLAGIGGESTRLTPVGLHQVDVVTANAPRGDRDMMASWKNKDQSKTRRALVKPVPIDMERRAQRQRENRDIRWKLSPPKYGLMGWLLQLQFLTIVL